jgi:hypothetical protein
MPFSRTNRMQKDLYVSGIADALSLTRLPSVLVSFDASFTSPFPLPLPVNRTGDPLTAEALTSSGS